MNRLWRAGLIPLMVAALALSACERQQGDAVATRLAESNAAAAATAIAQGTPADAVAVGVATQVAEGGGFGVTEGTPGTEGGVAVGTPGVDAGTSGYPAPGDGTIATPGPQETTVAVTDGGEQATPTTDGSAGTASEPETAPAEGGTTTYVVKAGDSLFTIAAALGITIEQLRALNPSLQNSDVIYVGQELAVPAPAGSEAQPAPPQEGPRIHVVQQGEWLYAIARQYGVTPQAIQEANPGVNLDTIYPGQEIIIP